MNLTFPTPTSWLRSLRLLNLFSWQGLEQNWEHKPSFEATPIVSVELRGVSLCSGAERGAMLLGFRLQFAGKAAEPSRWLRCRSSNCIYLPTEALALGTPASWAPQQCLNRRDGSAAQPPPVCPSQPVSIHNPAF